MQKTIGTFLPLTALRTDESLAAGRESGTILEALQFIDWLSSTGQGAWQLLPIAETHLEPGSPSTRVPSPYKGYGIGIDPAFIPPSRKAPTETELREFSRRHSGWLDDYALFCAIRDSSGTDDWTSWPEPLRQRDPSAIKEWAARHATQIRTHEAAQCAAHVAFTELRVHARAARVQLIGDLPFYLPLRSPLVWAFQECFDIHSDGKLRRVSGVPSGPKSYYGRQVWGHPLYRWKVTPERLAALWRMRIAHDATLYDRIRFDHVKGFYDYGAMDLTEPAQDAYLSGPGSATLAQLVAFARHLGLAPFAEDAGDKLDRVRHDLDRLAVPGVRILKFAYDERIKRFSKGYAEVRRYPRSSVAYTSVHDSDPLLGYARALDDRDRRRLCRRLRLPYAADEISLCTLLRDLAIRSPSELVIIPLQDWLLISDRINVPGTEKEQGDTNWRWRMPLTIEELPRTLNIT